MNKSFLFICLVLFITSINTQNTLRSLLTVNSISNDMFELSKTSFAPSYVEFKVDISSQRADTRLSLSPGDVYDVGLYDQQNFYFTTVTITKSAFINVALTQEEYIHPGEYNFALKPLQSENIYVCANKKVTVKADYVDIVSLSRTNLFYNGQDQIVTLKFNEEAIAQSVTVNAKINGNSFATVIKQIGKDEVDVTIPSSVTGKVSLQIGSKTVRTIYVLPSTFNFVFSSFTQCIYVHSDTEDVTYMGKVNDLNFDRFALSVVLTDDFGTVIYLPLAFASQSTSFEIYLLNSLKERGRFKFMIVDNNDMADPLYENEIWMSDPMIHKYNQFYEGDENNHQLDIEGVECPFEEGTVEIKEVPYGGDEHTLNCEGDGCKFIVPTVKYGEFVVVVKDKPVGLVNLNMKFSKADFEFEFEPCFYYSSQRNYNFVNLTSTNFNLEYITSIRIKNFATNTVYDLTTSPNNDRNYFVHNFTRTCDFCNRNLITIIIHMKPTDLFKIISITESINHETRSFEDEQHIFIGKPINYNIINTGSNVVYEFTNNNNAMTYMNYMSDKYSDVPSLCSVASNKINCKSSITSKSFTNFYEQCPERPLPEPTFSIISKSHSSCLIEGYANMTVRVRSNRQLVNPLTGMIINQNPNAVNDESGNVTFSKSCGMTDVNELSSKYDYECTFTVNEFNTLQEGEYSITITKGSKSVSINTSFNYYKRKTLNESSVLYGGIQNQEWTVKFNQKISPNEVSKISLINTIEISPKITLNTYNVIDDYTITFPNVNLHGFINGTYIPEIHNRCGNSYKVNSIDILTNQLISLTEVIKHSASVSDDQRLIYEFPFSSEDKVEIQLINIDDNTTIQIPNEATTDSSLAYLEVSSTPQTDQLLIIEENTMLMGYYKVQTKYVTNNIETISDIGFHVYHSQLTLLEQSYLVKNGTSFNVLKIPFSNDDIYASRIKQIVYNNETMIESYFVDANENTILLQESSSLTTFGKHDIYIYDLFAQPETPLIYSLIVITEMNFDKTVAMSKEQKVTFVATVNALIDDESLINKITTEKEDIEFTIKNSVLNEETSTTKLTLELELNDNVPVGKYEKVKVYNKNDSIVLEEGIEYFILDTTNAPIKVKSNLISVGSGDNEDFSIQFSDNVELDDSFLNEFNAEVIAYADICDFTFISIDSKNKKLYANSSCLVNDVNFTFTLTFMDVPVTSEDGSETIFTIDYTYTACDPPFVLDKSTKKCRYCEELDATTPIYSEGKCVDKCNDNDVLYDKICYNTCNDVEGHNYKYKQVCYESCEEATLSNSIEQGYLNLNVSEKECVETCEFGFAYAKICYPRDILQMVNQWDNCTLISDIVTDNSFKLSMIVNEKYNAEELPRVVKARLNKDNSYYIELNAVYDETKKTYSFNEIDRNQLVVGEYQLELCLVDNCAEMFTLNNTEAFYISKPKLAMDHYFYKEKFPDSNTIIIKDLLCNPNKFVIMNDMSGREAKLNCVENFPGFNNYTCKYKLSKVEFGAFSFGNDEEGKEIIFETFTLNKHISEVQFEVVRPICILGGTNTIGLKMKDSDANKFNMEYITSIIAYNDNDDSSYVVLERKERKEENGDQMHTTEEGFEYYMNSFEMGENNSLLLYIELMTTHYKDNELVHIPLHLKKMIVDDDAEQVFNFPSSAVIEYKYIFKGTSPDDIFLPLPTGTKKPIEFKMFFDVDITQFKNNLYDFIQPEEDYAVNCTLLTDRKTVKCYLNHDIEYFDTRQYYTRVKCSSTSIVHHYSLSIIKYELPDDYPLCQTKDKTTKDLNVQIFGNSSHYVNLYAKSQNTNFNYDIHGNGAFFTLTFPTDKLPPNTYSFHLNRNSEDFDVYSKARQNEVQILPLIETGTLTSTVCAGLYNQQIVIKLDQPYKHTIPEVTLGKYDTPILCSTDYQSTGTTLTCKDVDATRIKNGEHQVNYKDNCGTSISTSILVSVTVNEITHFTSEKSNAPKNIADFTDGSSRIKIHFQQNFNLTSDLISFTFKDYADESQHIFNFVSSSGKIVTVEPDDLNSLKEGYYSVTPKYTLLPELEPTDNPFNVIILRSKFALADESVSMSLMQRTVSDSFTLAFKHAYFNDRIKEIKYRTPSSSTPTKLSKDSYTISVIDDKTVVSLKMNLSIKGTWKIEFIDVAGISAISTLNVIVRPTAVTVPDFVYLTPTTKSFQITFNQGINDIKMFKEIYLEKSGQKHYLNITLASSHSSYTKFMLSLFDENSFTYDEFSSLVFIDPDGKDIILSTSKILIMKKEKLPPNLLTTSYVAIPEKPSINLLFAKQLYTVYDGSIKIKKLPSKTEDNCIIEEISEELNSINITCNSFKTLGEYKYEITIHDKTYETFTVKVQTEYCLVPFLGDSPELCQTCAQKNANEPYYYLRGCLSTCGDMFEYNNVCYLYPSDYIELLTNDNNKEIEYCNLIEENKKVDITFKAKTKQDIQEKQKEFYFPFEFKVKLKSTSNIIRGEVTTNNTTGEYTFTFKYQDIVEGTYQLTYYYINDASDEIDLTVLSEKYTFTSISFDNTKLISSSVRDNVLRLGNSKCKLTKAKFVHKSKSNQILEVKCSNENTCSYKMTGGSTKDCYGEYYFFNGNFKHSQTVTILKPISEANFVLQNFPTCFDYDRANPVINTFYINLDTANKGVCDLSTINEITLSNPNAEAIRVVKSLTESECISNCFFIDSTSLINVRVALNSNREYKVKEIATANPADVFKFSSETALSIKSPITNIKPDYFIINSSSSSFTLKPFEIDFDTKMTTASNVYTNKLLTIENNVASCNLASSKLKCTFKTTFNPKTEVLNDNNTSIDIGFKCSNTVTQKRNSFTLITYNIEYSSSKCMTKSINVSPIKINFNSDKNKPAFKFKIKNTKTGLSQNLTSTTIMSNQLSTSSSYEIYAVDNQNAQTLLDTFKVIDNIQIMSINELYADSPNQKMEITLRETYTSTMTNLVLQNEYDSPLTPPAKCTVTTTQATCTVDLTGVAPGRYNIAFTDGCSNTVNPPVQVTVKLNEAKPLTTEKFDVSTSAKNITIVFASPISDSISVELIDVSNPGKVIVIPSEYIYSNGNNVIFTVLPELSNEGQFNIKVYNRDDNTIVYTVSNTIIITLISQTPKLGSTSTTVINSDTSKNIKLPFTGVPSFYDKLISSVTLYNPSNKSSKLEYTLTTNSNTNEGVITITSEIQMNVNGGWKIIVKDVFNRQYQFIITVISSITVTYPSVFIIDNRSFNIQFSQAIPDLSLFSIITTSTTVTQSSQSQFTITKQQGDTTNKKFTLTLKDEVTYTISTKQKVHFYNKNNNIITTAEIIFLPPHKIPSQFVTLVHTIERYSESLTISFDPSEYVFDKYINLIEIKNDKEKCTVNSINDDKTIIFHCPSFSVVGTYTYNYYFNGNQLTQFTITINEKICSTEGNLVFDPSTKQCKLCSAINKSKPFFYKYNCFAKCPDGMVTYNNACYNNCQSVHGADAILYNENGVCKTDCTNGFKYQFNCVSTCEEGLFNNYKDKSCDTECPHGTLKYLTGCYATCSKAKETNKLSFNLVEHDEKCVKQCKSNEVSYGGVCYANCGEVPQDLIQDDTITLYNKTGFCVDLNTCAFYVEEDNTCFDEDCPDHYPYYIEDTLDTTRKCYESCPTNTAEYEMKCYRDCENIDYVPQILMAKDGHCVEICESNELLYRGKCYTSCEEPSLYFNVELFKNRGYCQETCPKPMLKYEYECRDYCPPETGLFQDNDLQRCVETCSTGLSRMKLCVSSCFLDGIQLYLNKSNSECVEECQEGLFIENGYTCVEECKNNIDYETKTCINSCKPNQVILENDTYPYCYNECPSEFPFKKGKVCVNEEQCLGLNYIFDGNECVKECPITKVKRGNYCNDSCSEEGEIIYKRECFESCSHAAQMKGIEQLFLSEDGTECYDRCPEARVPGETKCTTCDLTTSYIINDECVSESPDKGNCGRCHYQGSHKCNDKRHENTNKKCECKEEYTGASCEYYLGGEDFEEEKYATLERALDSVDYSSHSNDTDYRIEDVTQIIIDVGTQDSMHDYLYNQDILDKCQDIVDNSMEQLKSETENLTNSANSATHDNQLSMGGMAIAAQIVINKGNGNGNGNNGNGNGNNGNNGNGNKKLRNIEETDQIKPIIDILAEYYFTYYISQKMKLSSNKDYPTVEISEGVLSIQIWTDSTSKETLNKDATYYNISLTNISKCISAEDRELYKTIIYAKIDIDSSLTKIMSKGDGSINSNVFYIKVAGVKDNNKFDMLELDVCNEFTSRIPLEISSMNKDIYGLAKKAGIEVYDANTELDYCTINDHFEFDLPKNYIQQLTNLNQKIYTVDVLGNPLNDCKYSTFDIETNAAEIICSVNPTSTNFGVQITPSIVKDNVDIKSAFKCVHKVRNLGHNIGFLLSMILIALMIVANLVYVLITCSNKELDNSDVQALSNDMLVIQRFSLEEIKEEPDAPEKPKEVVAKPRLPPTLRDDEIIVENINKEKRVWLKEEEEDKIKIQKRFDHIFEVECQGSFELLHGPSDLNEDDEDKALKEQEPKRKPLPKRLLKTVMQDNFAELYPIVSLFRLSLVTPFFLRMAYLVFHLLSLILTCAVVLMLNEKNIENRAKDTNRKSFLYPLTNEYIVIAMSIAVSMVLTLLIKLIAMVTYDTKFSLYDTLTSDKELLDNKKEAIQSFTKQHKVRRIVGSVIIFALGAGMLVVTMILCNYYVQTQIGLGLCFLWAILVEYIVLIPIFILIIGGIEHASPESKCVYYTKRLFMF